MHLTKSEIFKYCHQVTKLKNIEYFGSYQKAFAHVLREVHAQGGLVWGFNV